MNIPNANEMRNDLSETIIAEICENLVAKIKEATQKGRRKTYFNLYSKTASENKLYAGDYESQIKKLFEQKGYYFTPTGYIGGVWQRTEDINW